MRRVDVRVTVMGRRADGVRGDKCSAGKIERGTIRGTKQRPTGGLVEHGECFDVQGCAV